MDLREAKLILEKINRLFESMALDERKISSFEKDLMLSYTKQLHDSFQYEESKPLKKVEPSKPAPTIQEKKAEPKVVSKETTPNPPKVEKVEKTKSKPDAGSVPGSTPKVTAAPSPAVATKQPQVLAPNMEDLFESEGANELSHRLSQAPIEDLSKAMGINERILTINELFGKDDTFYSEIVTKLNRLANFGEAKLVLAQLAQKFNWTDEGKKKKAKIFIKLVRRRYL
ncbi:MAG: hypothetical protein HKN16_07620 [Saprospiraceae bacterium]|nr:hypothetical protein [Saprospiraceae bacterium]